MNGQLRLGIFLVIAMGSVVLAQTQVLWGAEVLNPKANNGKKERTAARSSPQVAQGPGQEPKTSTEAPPAAQPQRRAEANEPGAGAPPSSSRGETGGFTIKAFIVEGSQLLPSAKVDAILKSYQGPGKTIVDIEKARLELEKAYQSLGYPTVLVVVPEQTVEEGTVRLNVVEARLVSITVTGNEYWSKYNIMSKLPSLEPGALLYEPKFVKELDNVNANPDLKIAPVLKPGSEPGTVDLELRAKERLPLHAKVTGDNKGPFTTPRDRITFEAQYANLWDHDHILTLTTTQTPTSWGAVQSYGFSYVAPVIWPDHLLAVYASKIIASSVLAGALLPVGAGDISVAGNATVAGFRYIFPIFTGGAARHQLTMGIDYKRLEETSATFPEPLGSAVVLSPIQYLPVSIAYNGVYPDTWGMTAFSSSLRGYYSGVLPDGESENFGGDPDDPFGSPGNRRGSTGTFVVYQGSLDRTQPLPYGFLAAAHIDGQWANEPLIPAEAYFAGGMDTVRGYIQNEALGDNALRVRGEVYTPDLPSIPIDRFWQQRRSSTLKATVKFLGFYDNASLWVQQAPPGQLSYYRLEGVGGGLRVKVEPINLTFQFDQAVALQTTPATKRGDTFAHFSLVIGF
jgi:hemolysin activation/secretion protein